MKDEDGFISLAALQWLADQDASFVMLERDGRVLATTGPVRPSEAKLRRAQALSRSSGAALRISRELISRKLTGGPANSKLDLEKIRAAAEPGGRRSRASTYLLSASKPQLVVWGFIAN